MKLDVKDRKILYNLDLNSRQSFSQVGKKVGLPKNTVGYRVKKLEEEGIIRNFYTVVDIYNLGYIIMRFHYKFQYTTPKIEEEIVDYFMKEVNFYACKRSVNGHYYSYLRHHSDDFP